MPTATLTAPDGTTLTIPYTGAPPSQADVQDIIDGYEKAHPPRLSTASAGSSLAPSVPMQAAPSVPMQAAPSAPSSTAPGMDAPASFPSAPPGSGPRILPPSAPVPTQSAASPLAPNPAAPSRPVFNPSLGYTPGAPNPNYHAPGVVPDLSAPAIRTDMMGTVRTALANLNAVGTHYEHLIQLGKVTPEETTAMKQIVQKNVDDLKPTGFLNTVPGQTLLHRYVTYGTYKDDSDFAHIFGGNGQHGTIYNGLKDTIAQLTQNAQDAGTLAGPNSFDPLSAQIVNAQTGQTFPQASDADKSAARQRLGAQVAPHALAEGVRNEPWLKPAAMALGTLAAGPGTGLGAGLNDAGSVFHQGVRDKPVQLVGDAAPFLLKGAGLLTKGVARRLAAPLADAAPEVREAAGLYPTETGVNGADRATDGKFAATGTPDHIDPAHIDLTQPGTHTLPNGGRLTVETPAQVAASRKPSPRQMPAVKLPGQAESPAAAAPSSGPVPEQKAPPGALPVAAAKPLYEMTPGELRDAHAKAKLDDKALEDDIFGPDGGQRYRALRRKSESLYGSHADTDAATKQMQAMENSLPQAQQDRLFGIYDPNAHAPEDYQAFLRGHANTDLGTPEGIAESIRAAITKVKPGQDPLTMTQPEQVAYAVIRRGMLAAKQQGFDTAAISKMAVQGAAQRFDPGDVDTMLGDYLQPGETPAPSKKALLDPSYLGSGLGALHPLAERATDLIASHIHAGFDELKAAGAETAFHTRNGRYRNAYAFDKDTGDAVNQAAASGERSQAYAHLMDKHVHAGLTPKQRDLLGRYYADQRAQAFEAAGNTAHNVPKLTPAERAQVAADPKIQAAIQKYEQQPGAWLFQSRKYVSPRMKTTATPSGHFASLIPADTVPGTGKPGGSLASQLRVKSTRFAKTATGGAQQGYNTDLGTNLHVTVPEVMGKASQRQMYKTALAARDSGGNALAFTNALGKDLPKTITWEGREYRASPPIEVSTRAVPGRKLADGSTGKPILQTVKMVVPDGYADGTGGPSLYHDLLDAATKSHMLSSQFDSVRRWGGWATGISLTSPAEVMYHANRVLSLAKAVPGMTSGVPLAGRAQTLAKLINLDMSHPDNVAALMRLYDANAASSRPFAHSGGESNILSRYNHGTLFGLPEGKGIKQALGGNMGLDLRLRVAAENIRAKLEGNTDPKRVREFANQFGQYTSKPDTTVERARQVHPFAASSLPMRVTEMRQLVGDSGLKAATPKQKAMLRAQSLAAGVGGTALGMQIANHLLSGHWTWQNAAGHEFDIEAGKDKDGKPVYISGNVIAPAPMRALRTVGVQEMVANARTPAPGPGRLPQRLDQQAGAVTRGLANTGLEEANSPLASLALTTATGKAAYLTKGNTLLQVAPRAKDGQSQVLLNAGAGIGGLVPYGRTTPLVHPIGGGFQSPTLQALSTLGFLKKDADPRGNPEAVKLLAKGRGGANIVPDLEAAVTAGRMTQAEARRVYAQSHLAPEVAHFAALPLSHAFDAYDSASPQDKAKYRQALQKKIVGAAHARALTPALLRRAQDDGLLGQ